MSQDTEHRQTKEKNSYTNKLKDEQQGPH